MRAKKIDRSFKSKVIKIFSDLKDEKNTSVPAVVPVYSKGILLGYLRTVTKSSLYNNEEVRLLSKWRKQSEWWFPAQFRITTAGTKKWLQERLLDTKDRFLFIIETPSGIPIGHVGLFRFNFTENSCEVDNVIRGEPDIPGIMTYAVYTTITWAKKYLGVKKFYLEVFSDNEKAIKLYERCGFREINRVPMKKIVEKNRVDWIEIQNSNEKFERYNIYMKYSPSK